MAWGPTVGHVQANREALQKKEVERQADMRAQQQELAAALQVSACTLQNRLDFMDP